jgi:hypothetical protein
MRRSKTTKGRGLNGIRCETSKPQEEEAASTRMPNKGSIPHNARGWSVDFCDEYGEW